MAASGEFGGSLPAAKPVAKSYPYGISSWEQLVADGALYIDKTKAIEQMERADVGRYLKLWRPRGSGKSLFCNQLALYYDIAICEDKVR